MADVKIDFEQIGAAVLTACPGLLLSWFPRGKVVGHEFEIGNLQGHAGKSLKINFRTGRWSDFATGEAGGDLISLYAAKHGLSQVDAAETLNEKIGVSTQSSAPRRNDDWDPFRVPSVPPPMAAKPRITLVELAVDKGLPEAFLREQGVEQATATSVRITYWLEDGSLAPRQRIRTALQAKEGSYWKPGDGSPVPYGSQRLHAAREAGYLILVEGESDVWTCWFHGIPALGIPGADMTGTLGKSHLEDIDQIYIIEKPDQGGATFVAGIARRLSELGWSGVASVATMPSGVKDPNEPHKRDAAGFKAAFQSALDAARPMPASDEDPLANIGDRARSDRGAPFEPDVLSALVDLRETDPAQYARVRSELRRSGTLLGDLDRQMRMSRLRLIEGGRSDVVAAQPAEQTDRYCVDDGAICSVKLTSNRPVHVPLCNFQARIVAEEVHDDGDEERRVLVIEGALQCGTTLPRVPVAAERFPSMAWVSANWGTSAIVCAGWSTKDQLREAIQRLSGDVPRTIIYVHIGWREIGGEWMYLHAGGAIGAGGIDSSIQTGFGDHRLRNFDLPAPPEGDALNCAVRASLSILDVAPHSITVPLLAAVCRAPLNVAAVVDFTVFMTDQTGTKKTALTALAQTHFGRRFDDRHLPGNWESTANALEKQAFLAKDAVLTVDDFAPGGTTVDVQRLHRQADRLLRAQGNLAGRQRMGPDGSLRAEYVPRGLILSSGEDVPRGQSLRARMFIVDIATDAVDVRSLSAAQNAGAEGHLALAMAAYVQWLASRIDTLRESLPAKQRHRRDALRASGTGHDRTPDLVASLGLGWEVFIQFARSAGAIGDDEVEGLLETGRRVLVQAPVAQSEHLSGEEPAIQFLQLLRAALASGKAHISDTKTGERATD